VRGVDWDVGAVRKPSAVGDKRLNEENSNKVRKALFTLAAWVIGVFGVVPLSMAIRMQTPKGGAETYGMETIATAGCFLVALVCFAIAAICFAKARNP
jgi:protein-S-isoprenylcysteine O-methyltransferase Ste14